MRIRNGELVTGEEVKSMGAWWMVIPDDADIDPQFFGTKRDALEWAGGLPCGYILEHV